MVSLLSPLASLHSLLPLVSRLSPLPLASRLSPLSTPSRFSPLASRLSPLAFHHSPFKSNPTAKVLLFFDIRKYLGNKMYFFCTFSPLGAYLRPGTWQYFFVVCSRIECGSFAFLRQKITFFAPKFAHLKIISYLCTEFQ